MATASAHISRTPIPLYSLALACYGYAVAGQFLMQAVCVKCEHPHVCGPACIIADHHHGAGASMLSRESVGVIDELPIRCNKRGGTHLGSIHWKGKGRLSRRCSRHIGNARKYIIYILHTCIRETAAKADMHARREEQFQHPCQQGGAGLICLGGEDPGPMLHF